MPRKKRTSSPFELYDDDFDEDASSQGSRNGNPPVQRNAANARERLRMRVLSSAYGRLKTKLPNIPPDTKLSKLDTLRLATLYIKQLIAAVENGTSVSGDSLDTNQMVEQGVGGSGGVGITNGGAFGFHHAGHGSMSWPFEFHNTNRHVSFPQMRMDWCQSNTPAQDNYLSKLQNNSQQHQQTHEGNSVHLNELQVHWYSQEAAPQHHNISSDTSCYMFQELQEQSSHHQRSVQHMQNQQSYPQSL